VEDKQLESTSNQRIKATRIDKQPEYTSNNSPRKSVRKSERPRIFILLQRKHELQTETIKAKACPTILKCSSSAGTSFWQVSEGFFELFRVVFGAQLLCVLAKEEEWPEVESEGNREEAEEVWKVSTANIQLFSTIVWAATYYTHTLAIHSLTLHTCYTHAH